MADRNHPQLRHTTIVYLVDGTQSHPGSLYSPQPNSQSSSLSNDQNSQSTMTAYSYNYSSNIPVDEQRSHDRNYYLRGTSPHHDVDGRAIDLARRNQQPTTSTQPLRSDLQQQVGRRHLHQVNDRGRREQAGLLTPPRPNGNGEATPPPRRERDIETADQGSQHPTMNKPPSTPSSLRATTEPNNQRALATGIYVGRRPTARPAPPLRQWSGRFRPEHDPWSSCNRRTSH